MAYVCDICSSQFTRNDSLLRHRKSKHSNEAESDNSSDTDQDDSEQETEGSTSESDILSADGLPLIHLALSNADVGINELKKETLLKLVESADVEEESEDTEENMEEDNDKVLNSEQVEFLIAIVKAGKREVYTLRKHGLKNLIENLN